jgi:hypothetical protein
MKIKFKIAALLLAGCVVAAHADCPTVPEISGQVTASRLSADAALARYAIYHAASGTVRDLGRQRTAMIQQYALARHIQLPSSMSERDLRMVKRLERLEGDDFDVAFITLGNPSTDCNMH